MADPIPAATPAPAPAAAAPAAPTAEPAASPSILGAATLAEPAKPAEGGEPAKPADAAFDAATLKLPEGFEAKPELMTKFGDLAKKFGLSQDAAQDLVNLQAEALKGNSSQQQDAWTKTQTTWQDAVKADPEIGGAKLPGVLQTISKAIDQFGTPGFKPALDLTGAGNNPDIVKTFYKMAQALTEGKPVSGSPPAQKPQGNSLEAIAGRMYPSMQQQG